MAKKKKQLDYSCGECNVGMGSLSPLIACSGRKFNTDLILFRLRPLYNNHEENIAALLHLNGVKDMSIGKTFRDGIKWLKEQLGIGAAASPAEP